MKAINRMIALIISVSLLTVGCGKKEESIIDKGIKTTVETGLKVVKTVDDANNAKTRFSVMKDNKEYAKFELLKLGIPYLAACTVMTAPPSQNVKVEIVDVRKCSWDLENNVKIECEFRNGKLFGKKFNSNQIFVKEPFTKAQFNQIKEGDTFSAVKQKLNNQDGYLCEQMEGIGSPFDTYIWRNPDGSAAKVQFSGSLCFKKEFINEQVSLKYDSKASEGKNVPAHSAQKNPQKVSLSAEEKHKLDVFFSNFAEAWGEIIPKFTFDGINNAQLIQFGMAHNVINRKQVVKTINGKQAVPVGEVRFATMKYFGKDVQPQSVGNIDCDGTYFYTVRADRNADCTARIKELFDNHDGTYTASYVSTLPSTDGREYTATLIISPTDSSRFIFKENR